jgi:hypothetical protein
MAQLESAKALPPGAFAGRSLRGGAEASDLPAGEPKMSRGVKDAVVNWVTRAVKRLSTAW